MLDYIEFFKIPTGIAFIVAGFFFLLQIIGDVLKVKGKVVPEIMDCRERRKRKKIEREAISKLPELLAKNEETSKTLQETNKLLHTVEKHYAEDNISRRNKWMTNVDEKSEENAALIKQQGELVAGMIETMERIKQDTLSILIDNKRNAIIDFAARVSNKSTSVTHEQFIRVFKIHKEYKEIIEENNLTNGEVDIAYRIIEEAYEEHMKNASFLEDIRGYR